VFPVARGGTGFGSDGLNNISRDEALHGQWSFFVCRNGTADYQLSQHSYIGD
jgi:hypothetical protein